MDRLQRQHHQYERSYAIAWLVILKCLLQFVYGDVILFTHLMKAKLCPAKVGCTDSSFESTIQSAKLCVQQDERW